MPLRYEIDPQANVVRIIGTGHLSMTEMIATVDELAEDPQFRSGVPVIFDIRQARYEAGLEDGDLFAAALKRREADFQGRFALVVSESIQVLAKLYCVVAKVAGVERMSCFTDVDEAIAWCGESSN